MGNIVKDQSKSLEEIVPGLNKILVGFSWDVPEQIEHNDVDVDVAAFLLKPDGNVRYDTDFVFYNNLETDNGSVKHLGDCKTPEGKGDNERVQILLQEVGFDVDRIAFSLTFHNSHERLQDLTVFKGGFLRVIDVEQNKELIRFDLEDLDPECDSLIFGELIRDTSGWTFNATKDGRHGGLYSIASDFGVNVAPN